MYRFNKNKKKRNTIITAKAATLFTLATISVVLANATDLLSARGGGGGISGGGVED
jgi:hypothetical protein